jgi:hypothetical protein
MSDFFGHYFYYRAGVEMMGVCDSASVNSIIFKSKKIRHCHMIEKDAMGAIRGGGNTKCLW